MPVAVQFYRPGWVDRQVQFALSAFTCIAVPMLGVVLVARAVRVARGAPEHRRRADLQWRLDHHICLACGFDVRATPDRCPDCGARQERWWA